MNKEGGRLSLKPMISSSCVSIFSTMIELHVSPAAGKKATLNLIKFEYQYYLFHIKQESMFDS